MNNKPQNFNQPGSGKNVATATPANTTSNNTKPASSPAAAVLAAANAAASKPAPASTTEVKITHEMIATAAYLRWQRHGGDPHTNWVEAEKELRAKFRK